ncbi:sugar kinase [Roseomonas xinghualingensis]|uniref:sugar kinase n=1 Tax=Roseomonas xinghualingensis TaxID=2986475 RepID=UPI0021F167FA|nr:sugar kinase [Roseomonas sp. SXEYE001]MCV4209394.1 sugar kinase [Roseomonas sp. SXEYE001]
MTQRSGPPPASPKGTKPILREMTPPTPAAQVTCVGECMIELRERQDGLLSRGFGGDTLNTAIYLARLGIAVEYVTALGDDAHSEDMLRAWKEEGVGTELVLRLPGYLPGLYMIQTDTTGERRFSYWRDRSPVRRLFDLPETPHIEAALAASNVIYLSGITLSLFHHAAREQLFVTLEAARAQGGRVVFDSNFRPRGWHDPEEARASFQRTLSLSDTVLAGVEDFALLDGEGSAKALIARLRRAGVAEAVVKLQEPGCIVLHGMVETPVPQPEVVTPRDTTAAGDSFAAAFLAARLSGLPPEAAACAGHRLANAVIRHPGAIIPRDAMPIDVLRLLTPPETT